MSNVSYRSRARTVWIPLRMSTEICRLGEGHSLCPCECRLSVGKPFLRRPRKCCQLETRASWLCLLPWACSLNQPSLTKYGSSRPKTKYNDKIKISKYESRTLISTPVIISEPEFWHSSIVTIDLLIPKCIGIVFSSSCLLHKVSIEHLQRVRHANRGRLLLWTPWPVQLWDLHVFYCWVQSLLNLSCFRIFEFRTSLGTSVFASYINAVLWEGETLKSWGQKVK